MYSDHLNIPKSCRIEVRRALGPLYIALLVTTLLVVSLVLIGAAGTLMAQTVVTPVTVGTTPNAVGVNPTTNKVYVANMGSGTVSVIDGATNGVTPIVIGPFDYPGPVAVNPTTNKIYVANTGSSSVSVIDGATNGVTPVAVGTNPFAVGVNSTTNKIYTANFNSSTVSVIDGATNSVTPIVIGPFDYPGPVAVNPTTNKVYVANQGSNDVSVIDGATNSVTPVAVGTNPFAVGVNSTTNKIYTANLNSNNVSVIKGEDNSVETVAVGTTPNAVGVNPTNGKIYVANAGSNNVSVIYDPPVPTTTGLSPDHKTAGGSGFTLTVNGTNFITSSVVRWKGSDRTTTYVSDTQLTASIPATDIQTAGTAQVTVFTPGAGESNPQAFTVNPSTFYFAEGTCRPNFDPYICIQNPGNTAANVTLTYMKGDGSTATDQVSVAPNSRSTVVPRTKLGTGNDAAHDFSTMVTSDQPIIAERPMYFNYNGVWTGGHDVVGFVPAQ